MHKTTQNRYTKQMSREIGVRIADARLNAYGEVKSVLTQTELAERVNKKFSDMEMTGRTIGNIERGERLVRVDELVAIADVLEVTEQELLTGVKPEHVEIERVTGLEKDSVRYLERIHTESPEFMTMVNLVFSNKELANILIRSLLLYSNAQMLAISPLTKKDPNHFIGVDTETGNEMIKQVALQKLSRLLESIQEKWNTVLFPIQGTAWKRIKKKARAENQATIDRLKYKWRESERHRYGYPTVDLSDDSTQIDMMLDELERVVDEQRQNRRMAILEKLLEDDTEPQT